MECDHFILDTLPQEVKDAALLLERHFRENGAEDWALFGCCSRAMFDRTKSQLEAAQGRLAFESGSW